MAIEKYQVRELDPFKVSNEIGIIPKSGLIVYNGSIDLRGMVIPRFFLIRVAGGGDLFIRGIDGKMIPYLGVLDGQIVPGVGNIIYNTVVFDAVTYATTCTGICAYGGQ